jgi:hypothetical protein
MRPAHKLLVAIAATRAVAFLAPLLHPHWSIKLSATL